MDNENTNNSFGGYIILIFTIFLGLLFFFFGEGWLFYLGLPFLIFGFLFLSAQLSEDDYVKYAIFSGGIGFLLLALYFVDLDFFVWRILFFVLLAGSFTCFISTALYIVFKSKGKYSFSNSLFSVISLASSFYTVYKFIKEIVI
ncbi:hypothetical protein ACF91D_29685 [Staphylococcus sp. 231237_7MaSpsaltlick]|uniref:hypothetical protein n=1 Tax=Staphylococcus TaxID=1279 RepID=UPI001868E74F|nr:hypothetical protein [Staphylococcus cohnii]